MRATPSSEPRRRVKSIAVEWRDCAWSPPIVVRSTAAESRRLETKPLSVQSAGGDEINAKAQRRKGMARQSRNQRNVAGKVARASRPCVSVTDDNFAETHGRDARATTSPEKHSSPASLCLCAFAQKSC